MKRLLMLALLFSIVIKIQTVSARTIEVEVYGMTCAFCVDSLERKFGKMESVSRIEVSMKMKIIRLQSDEDLPTEETIKQTILDAGFTPIRITVLPDETEQM